MSNDPFTKLLVRCLVIVPLLLAVAAINFMQARELDEWQDTVVMPVRVQYTDNPTANKITDYFQACASDSIEFLAHWTPNDAQKCLKDTFDFVEVLKLPPPSQGILEELSRNNDTYWRKLKPRGS
ncbi:hypothetical protein [Thalassospira xiamenensis]|uniref:Uncharacterized protein n=1 Tax=Thalassospira xiamenensis TaxID=220697 RepID=A0A285TR99_9PROT|nr:hypothetical protein [Thalassospira xiamenensis]SOC26096.1 hypothetical protein SAMN05428964_10548 [Thalassospira xiamenensis]